MYLPFPLSPSPPTSPHTMDCFKGARRAFGLSEDIYEATEMAELVIHEVEDSSVTHLPVFVLSPSLASLSIFPRFYFPGI